MVELAQQAQQLMLLVIREWSQEIGNQRFLPRHQLVKQRPAPLGERQAVGAALLPPRDQPFLLELAKQLRDIPFGYQERRR